MVVIAPRHRCSLTGRCIFFVYLSWVCWSAAPIQEDVASGALKVNVPLGGREELSERMGFVQDHDNPAKASNELVAVYIVDF